MNIKLEDIHRLTQGSQDVLFDKHYEENKLTNQPRVDSIIEKRSHKIIDNCIIKLDDYNNELEGIANIIVSGTGKWKCDLEYGGQRYDTMSSESNNVIWQTEDNRCIPFVYYHKIHFNFKLEFGSEITLSYDIVSIDNHREKICDNPYNTLREYIVCCQSPVIEKKITGSEKIPLSNCANPLFEIHIKTSKPIKSARFYTHKTVSFPLVYDKMNDGWTIIIQERGINNIITDNSKTINASRLDDLHIYIENDRNVIVNVWCIYANFVRRLSGMIGYAYSH
jgi:hypothetical protein